MPKKPPWAYTLRHSGGRNIARTVDFTGACYTTDMEPCPPDPSDEAAFTLLLTLQGYALWFRDQSNSKLPPPLTP
eukprot:CAMPEP_0206480570 /NCGR_PEP_ID=MMETSP0324_2-20121206/37456_1 /ASSEMBLY_ACC=CAM_ASM_000836 /TAXON_ID=2866 /ORGANISM="Crypthecodinium cohnii, Strain Seligo" /LENGTH=74 /DNA_ID=CAMNT_0053957549 /DNA_START=98 /DNA_END=322 /DNA_ORIENTATION=-